MTLERMRRCKAGDSYNSRFIVAPAKAGAQVWHVKNWAPAYAGATRHSPDDL